MKHTEIIEAVASGIAASHPSVIEGVKAKLITAENDRRIEAVAKALELLRVEQNELKKMKPDVPATFNADGVLVSPEGFTKATAEKRTKKAEEIAKIENAINKSLDETKKDFGDLFKLTGNKGGAATATEAAAA